MVVDMATRTQTSSVVVNLNVDVESFRVACAPVIEKNPDLFLPELVKMARSTPA